ncbi:hypothetical protein BKA82DRAFT_2016451 [Pisolithus tinctorius]|nr:hypothetical protein BKA82DRAFT_2016451 [Pisolithus tinctorius]
MVPESRIRRLYEFCLDLVYRSVVSCDSRPCSSHTVAAFTKLSLSPIHHCPGFIPLHAVSARTSYCSPVHSCGLYGVKVKLPLPWFMMAYYYRPRVISLRGVGTMTLRCSPIHGHALRNCNVFRVEVKLPLPWFTIAHYPPAVICYPTTRC